MILDKIWCYGLSIVVRDIEERLYKTEELMQYMEAALKGPQRNVICKNICALLIEL